MSSGKAELILQSMRPKQWVKNLLLFAGLIFSQRMSDPALLAKVSTAFILFCLLSGATYLFNDTTDKESDAQNLFKNKRPVASGRLDVRSAIIWAGLLFMISIGLSFLLDVGFGVIALGYLATQLLYSFWLKKIVILDLFAVVFSHLLRVLAGTVLIGVEISSWLLVCTILLALFLVVCKRRHELIQSENMDFSGRMLGKYSVVFLDQMVSMVTSATVISYCLYTMSEQTMRQTGTTNLKFTIPFVLYGILRYIYLVYEKTEGSYPEETLLKDKMLLADIILWAGFVVGFLYF